LTSYFNSQGLFNGKIFPTPAQCEAVYNAMTWNEGTLEGNARTQWIYSNLGASSFFNDLFGAFEEVLRVIPFPLPTTCKICNTTPCMALNRALPPMWITKMQENNLGPHNRHVCYKACHPRVGFARIPIPDCWLLAIRCCLHGGLITGFQPKYLRGDNDHIVVPVPMVLEEEDDEWEPAADDNNEEEEEEDEGDGEEEENEEQFLYLGDDENEHEDSDSDN
jgi:hypothetical protein